MIKAAPAAPHGASRAALWLEAPRARARLPAPLPLDLFGILRHSGVAVAGSSCSSADRPASVRHVKAACGAAVRSAAPSLDMAARRLVIRAYEKDGVS